MSRRAIVIVLDSVGIGEAPDADEYDDGGAYTLQHTASAAGPLNLPTFQALGLGCIPPLLPHDRPINGVPPVQAPLAAYGAMQEVSRGKDTTTGHWEIAGLNLVQGFHVFPPGPPAFPASLTTAFEHETGRPVIGNKAASGTAIINELGEQHVREGCWIAYTSADSVLQIAAHEEIIPVDELYAACEVARRLCNAYPVGRVIARPFVGNSGGFTRTERRRDFSYEPPEPTILDRLQTHGVHVTTVGKLDDIFAHRGMDTKCHVENTADAQDALMQLVAEDADGFIFVNLIDFDMRYGHRRDPDGYARALENTDAWLQEFIGTLRDEDLLIITADHGNDPTYTGTDHTREYVPLLAKYGPINGRNLGIRQGFFDVAQTLADYFNIPDIPNGISFI